MTMKALKYASHRLNSNKKGGGSQWETMLKLERAR